MADAPPPGQSFAELVLVDPPDHGAIAAAIAARYGKAAAKAYHDSIYRNSEG